MRDFLKKIFIHYFLSKKYKAYTGFSANFADKHAYLWYNGLRKKVVSDF